MRYASGSWAVPLTAALSFLTPITGFCQGARLPDVINEIPREDDTTVSLDEKVRACSGVLKSGHGTETAQAANALKVRAQAYLRLHKKKLAKGDAEALCKLCPKDSEAHCLHAQVLAMLDLLPQAQTEIEEAIRLNPHVADYHAWLAGMSATRGDVKGGKDAMAHALKLDPECAAAHYVAGMIATHQGQFRAAVESLDKYLRQYPCGGIADPARPYLERGGALLALNRTREAVNNLVMARKLNPMSRDAARGLAHSYVALCHYRAAAKVCDELVKMKDATAGDWFLSGMAHAKAGNHRAAAESIQKGTAIMKVGDSNAAVAVSTVYYEIGDYAKCAEYLGLATKMNPKYWTAWEWRALLQCTCPDEKYRNGTAALRVLNEIHERVSYNPERPQYLLTVKVKLAAALADCDQFDDAAKLMRQVLEMCGPDYDRREYEQRLKLFESKRPYRHTVVCR